MTDDEVQVSSINDQWNQVRACIVIRKGAGQTDPWQYLPLPEGTSCAVIVTPGRGGWAPWRLEIGRDSGDACRAGLGTPAAMADQGALEAMAELETQEAMADQGALEAMAELETWEPMADQGALEAMAELETWEAMADQGALEAMAELETREAMADQGALEAMAELETWEAMADQGVLEAMAVEP